MPAEPHGTPPAEVETSPAVPGTVPAVPETSPAEPGAPTAAPGAPVAGGAARQAPTGPTAGRATAPRPDLGPWFPAHATLAAGLGVLLPVVWLLTGAPGGFWPAWAWFGLLVSLGAHLAVLGYARTSRGTPERLRVEVRLWVGLAVMYLAIWGLSGFGYFWPVWPMLGFGVALAISALTVHERLPFARARRLSARVDELTSTRRGALDEQQADLRRIERDLHDGAQARLVALSMKLGRAEARLDDDPEVRDLLAGARGDAAAAIDELRALTRGIAPAVLGDRGLPAAVEALARRSELPVEVDADVPRRPAPVVEAAAYFVVAEALTNAAKHAAASRALVTLREVGADLLVEVADDGVGGARIDGDGLAGLRRRVAALDGTLEVESPVGHATRVRALLPCGW